MILWSLCYRLLEKKKITVALDQDDHTFSLENGVRYAFSWANSDGIGDIDKSLGEISIEQEYYYECPEMPEGSCFEKTEIPLEPCTVDEFSQGITNIQAPGSTFYWPSKDYNFTLQSNAVGKQYKTVRVYFRVWVREDYCKPYQEAIQELKGSIVNLLIMTPYFDYSDIDKPVKYHIDHSHYLILNIDYLYIMDMFIRKSEYTLNDNIFGLQEAKSGVFYSMVNSKILPVASNRADFAQIYFNLDDQVDQYERTVQTIFEVIGTLGGNYEILRISIGLFLAIYTNKMLSYEVSNNCWLYTQHDKIENQRNLVDKNTNNRNGTYPQENKLDEEKSNAQNNGNANSNSHHQMRRDMENLV